MIYGIGIDITNIDRFKQLKNQDLFIRRVLTDSEITTLNSKQKQRFFEFLAGHFSAKEAYSKAFGTGIGSKLQFQDLTIDYTDLGQPFFIKHPFHGKAHVSISHSNHHVISQVILEEDK